MEFEKENEMTEKEFREGFSKKTDRVLKAKAYLTCYLDLANALVRLVNAGFSDEEVDFIVGEARAWANSKRTVGNLDKEKTK